MELIVAIALAMATAIMPSGFPIRPDAQLTPGAIRTTDAAVICATKTSTVRNVAAMEKSLVLNQYEHKYGVMYSKPYGSSIEFDHLLSLEIGGSNDLQNIWPQLLHVNLNGSDVGAKTKDILENKLHALICAGKVAPKDAQDALLSDWIAAYQKYVGPLPAFNP